MQKYHALARVFGSAGGLFGREDEQQVFSAVADAGLGPKVLVCFKTSTLQSTFLALVNSIHVHSFITHQFAVCTSFTVHALRGLVGHRHCHWSSSATFRPCFLTDVLRSSSRHRACQLS